MCSALDEGWVETMRHEAAMSDRLGPIQKRMDDLGCSGLAAITVPAPAGNDVREVMAAAQSICTMTNAEREFYKVPESDLKRFCKEPFPQ